jgi:hypothetical protein
VKNFLTVTVLALRVPMILMGDEARRTQVGNNNAYCQDNEISWFDWTLIEQHPDVHRFVTQLNARRLLRVAKCQRRLGRHGPGTPIRTAPAGTIGSSRDCHGASLSQDAKVGDAFAARRWSGGLQSEGGGRLRDAGRAPALGWSEGAGRGQTAALAHRERKPWIC